MSHKSTGYGRIAHITYPKCGSQWVRDVLSDQRIQKYSRYRLEKPDGGEFATSWARREPGVLVAPIYNTPLETWKSRSTSADKAVVVLRDPRDQIVSWIYSLSYSHPESQSTDIFRDLLQSLDDRAKLAVMCEHWRTFYASYRSFTDANSGQEGNLFVTTYETLVTDSLRTYSEIIDFFGWPVPSEVLREVVERHSFRAKTGRRRGKEDIRSHLRKGKPGDWRNYFDSAIGRFFEFRYNSILTSLGYEKNPLWFEELPDKPLRSFGAAQNGD